MIEWRLRGDWKQKIIFFKQKNLEQIANNNSFRFKDSNLLNFVSSFEIYSELLIANE